MSIRISIDDTSFDLAVTLHVSGGYNPDVLDDLTKRAAEAYRQTLADKIAYSHSAEAHRDEA